MRRLLVLILCVITPATTALADCVQQLASLQGTAKGVIVSVRQRTIGVGEALTVSWQLSERAVAKNVYLVIAAPPQTRFSGSGFVALAPQAKGLNGISFAPDSSRVFVPIFGDGSGEGEVGVSIYKRGQHRLQWSVVWIGECGQHILGTQQVAIAVTPGAPELVVHDRFSSAKPQRRIRAANSHHDLVAFADRYEIRDALTDDKLFEHTGRDANLSPTGRFVAARSLSSGALELFDLVSHTEIPIAKGTPYFEGPIGLLAWARGDSYAIFVGTSYGEMEIINTIVDRGSVYQQGMDCASCKALRDPILLDVDHGVAGRFKGTCGQFTRLTDRMQPSEAPGADVTDNANDKFPETTCDPLEFLRTNFGAHYTAIPKVWTFGEPVVLTHTYPYDLIKIAGDAKKDVAEQKSKLIRHADVADIRVPVPKRLVGRSLTGRGDTSVELATIGRATTSNVFKRLASLGVDTVSPGDVSRAYFNASVWDTLMALPDTEDRETGRTAQRVRKEIAGKLPGEPLPDTARCGFEQGQVPNGTISSIWRWQQEEVWFSLIQKFCYGGRHGELDEHLLLYNSAAAKGNRFVELKFEDRVNPAFGSFALYNEEASTRVRAFRVLYEVIALARPVTGTVTLMDASNGRRIDAVPLIEGDKLEEIRQTSDRRHVVQLNNDGTFFVHRRSDRQLVLKGAHVDDEVVITTPEGLYESTYEGAQALGMRIPGDDGIYRFSQFEVILSRNRLASAVLHGEPIAAPSSIGAPPNVQLILDGASSGDWSARIVVNAQTALARARIYIDGRLEREVPLSGMRAEATITVPDPGAGRWISVVAVGQDGLVSLPSSVLVPGKPKPNGALRAVVIGIDTYRDPLLPKLKSARRDAQVFATQLKSLEGVSFRSVEVTPLLNDQASVERIIEQIGILSEKTGPNDTALLFFAGHGLNGIALQQPNIGYGLAVSTTRTSEMERTALLWRDMTPKLAAVRGRLVVLLDACHSGLAGREGLSTNDEAVSALFTASGAPIVVIAGSKGRQSSLEASEARGGFFTNAMLRVLKARQKYDRNDSGLLDTGEFYAAVKADVVKATNGLQTPWLARNNLIGEFALF